MGSKLILEPLHVPGSTIEFDVGVQFTYEQKFSPNWTVEESYGKMDGIPFYSNTSRVIDVTFELLTKTVVDARNMNRQIDLLAKLQYPKYRSIGVSFKPGASGQMTFAGAPFFRMRAEKSYSRGSAPGTYQVFPTVTGYITNLSITPGVQAGYNVVSDVANNAAYQQHFSVMFTFTVIHEDLPGWTTENIFTQNSEGFYAVFSENSDEEPPPAPGGKHRGEDPDASLSASRTLQAQATEKNETADPNKRRRGVDDPGAKAAGEVAKPAKVTGG